MLACVCMCISRKTNTTLSIAAMWIINKSSGFSHIWRIEELLENPWGCVNEIHWWDRKHLPLSVLQSVFATEPKCLLLQNKNTCKKIRKYSSRGFSVELVGEICQFLPILIHSRAHLADGRQLSVLTLDKEDRAITYHQLELDCSKLAETYSQHLLAKRSSL